jgi:hypothetical protein
MLEGSCRCTAAARRARSKEGAAERQHSTRTHSALNRKKEGIEPQTASCMRRWLVLRASESGVLLRLFPLTLLRLPLLLLHAAAVPPLRATYPPCLCLRPLRVGCLRPCVLCCAVQRRAARAQWFVWLGTFLATSSTTKERKEKSERTEKGQAMPCDGPKSASTVVLCSPLRLRATTQSTATGGPARSESEGLRESHPVSGAAAAAAAELGECHTYGGVSAAEAGAPGRR